MTHGPSLPLTLTATLSQTLLNSSTSWPVIVGVLMIFFFHSCPNHHEHTNYKYFHNVIPEVSGPSLEASGTTIYLLLHVCECVCVFSITQLFPILCISHQAPLFVEFSRQEYWNRAVISSSRDLPNPGTKPASLASPALAGGYVTTAPAGELVFQVYK